MPEPRVYPERSRREGPSEASEYVEVTRAASLPPGKTLLVSAGDGPIILANVSGQFYALGGTCSHKRLSLDGAQLDGCRLICPWHFTEFDVRTGEQVKWAYGGPLATFPVKRDGDALFVKA